MYLVPLSFPRPFLLRDLTYFRPLNDVRVCPPFALSFDRGPFIVVKEEKLIGGWVSREEEWAEVG